jgi:hypothetical protein
MTAEDNGKQWGAAAEHILGKLPKTRIHNLYPRRPQRAPMDPGNLGIRNRILKVEFLDLPQQD